MRVPHPEPTRAGRVYRIFKYMAYWETYCEVCMNFLESRVTHFDAVNNLEPHWKLWHTHRKVNM